MNRILLVILLGAILGAGQVLAQEPSEPATAGAEAGSQPEQQAEEDQDEEELPEIDVWAEDADRDDDVFVPTESISADSSISFPADI